jgi:glycosyltransferase involved in cell wall biosynthesis
LAIEYNKARLCVYAPVKEPFGLVPLEAMACGTPVVGVREGGVSESVRHGETGLLTERDPRQFAEAIISLLNDPERRTQCGCQGRIFVEKQWQWEQSVRDLERHLTEVARCRQA